MRNMENVMNPKDMESKLASLNSLVTEQSTLITNLGIRVEELSTSCQVLTTVLGLHLNGSFEEPPEDETDEQRATRVGVLERISELEHLLRGRNRSAPVKRNMTDIDARRVLTGDVVDQGHKEAGELVGLTYAQVYSCRLEYTFKHIHKELRDGGWKNPWVKPKGRKG